MKVVIYDIFLGTMIFHSTPRPTMLGMLISGFHKSRGDQVLLTDEMPDVGLYDKIYLLKDAPDLFHDPQWLIQDRVIPVGKYWEGVIPIWNPEWELALPDTRLYQNWANNWIARYPTITKSRLESFYRTPVKMKQGNNIKVPEGNNLIIIDDDIDEWDENYEILKNSPIKNAILLYPLKLDGKWDAVLDTFSQKHLKRQYFWADMNFKNYNEDEINKAIEIYQKYAPGRMFRIKCHVEGNSNEEWIELIPKIYYFLERFRLECTKRVFIQPHGIDNFEFPRILTELKRWTAKDMGYAKNSLFDYMVYDGCRNVEKMAELLCDPYAYIAGKKLGKNKFVELIPFVEKYPELMDVITKSYNKAGW